MGSTTAQPGRGEPQGESSGGVLEEHGHEAFHRTEGCAVNHHGAVLLVVGSGVFELEAFGEVVVDLNCSELPAAAYCVLFDHEVELRAVEGCLTEFGAGFQSFSAQASMMACSARCQFSSEPMYFSLFLGSRSEI